MKDVFGAGIANAGIIDVGTMSCFQMSPGLLSTSWTDAEGCGVIVTSVFMTSVSLDMIGLGVDL